MGKRVAFPISPFPGCLGKMTCCVGGLGPRPSLNAHGAVSLVQGFANLNAEFHRVFHGQATTLQALGQRFALHIFHHEEIDAVLVADVVQRADARMVQCGNSAGLALEPLLQIGIGGEMLGKNFDGDVAT